MDIRPFALVLVGLGILLTVVGLFLHFGLFPSFLGKLPGDIRIERDNFRFYFPITTCILISFVLTALLALLSFLRR